MPNPFAKAGDAEDAAPETPPVEEEQEHPLFVEGDEADADEGDEADAALFDDDEDDDKPVPKATFKKRLDKVIAQREEARRERDQARGELTELRRTVSEARAAYGENPQLMQYDQQFMAKLEEVAKVDADAAKFAKAVDKAIKTGNWEPINKMTTTPSAPASEADATTKSDPKVEKILRQNAARTVDDVLESQGVKPSFGRVLRRHILDTSEDLSELTAE